MGLTGASASSIEQLAGNPDTTTSWPDKITVRDGGEIRLIRVDDIRWIDAAGDYMCIHAGSQTHIMRTTMKQLEALLDPARFLRIHRSTIVNSAGITAAQPLNNGEYLLTLEGETRLKVSRGYRDRVKSLLAGTP
jgi:two-component system LytT family response regulator